MAGALILVFFVTFALLVDIIVLDFLCAVVDGLVGVVEVTDFFGRVLLFVGDFIGVCFGDLVGVCFGDLLGGCLEEED